MARVIIKTIEELEKEFEVMFSSYDFNVAFQTALARAKKIGEMIAAAKTIHQIENSHPEIKFEIPDGT